MEACAKSSGHLVEIGRELLVERERQGTRGDNCGEEEGGEAEKQSIYA